MNTFTALSGPWLLRAPLEPGVVQHGSSARCGAVLLLGRCICVCVRERESACVGVCVATRHSTLLRLVYTAVLAAFGEPLPALDQRVPPGHSQRTAYPRYLRVPRVGYEPALLLDQRCDDTSITVPTVLNFRNLIIKCDHMQLHPSRVR